MLPASASFPWLAAAAAGLLAAALGYWPPARGWAGPALLRFAAVALAVALLLDAPVGRAARPAPLVAIDVSASAGRAGALAEWRATVARVARDGDALAVGDSLRPLALTAVPADLHSRVAPAVDRATAAGRPLLLYTDGEIDDANALGALPAGSRVERLTSAARMDAAISDVTAPRAAGAGDTLRGTARVVADSGGSAATSLTLLVDGRPAARVEVPALGAYGEAGIPFTLVAPARGPALVRLALAPGDAEATNDTLSFALDVTDAAAIVSVSTSPDYDWRYATALLREAASVPVRGYVRVAPRAWRDDATLGAVPESEVRARVRAASVVLLHGDTLAFGPPAAATRGALVLYPAERGGAAGEWFAGAAPPSPASASLADTPWDSLPPVDPPAAAPAATWVALTARAARRGEAEPVVIGREGARRSAVILSTGLWRWRFRGGAAARAYGALWGSIFDWAAAEAAPRQPLVAADAIVRAGDSVRWRRAPDSTDSALVTLVRRGAPGGVVRLVVRFERGANVGESGAVPAGVYDVGGGSSGLLVVNPSREWVPRRSVAFAASAAVAPVDQVGLRSRGWPFVVAVLLLCGEWLLRRRAGWR